MDPFFLLLCPNFNSYLNWTQNASLERSRTKVKLVQCHCFCFLACVTSPDAHMSLKSQGQIGLPHLVYLTDEGIFSSVCGEKRDSDPASTKLFWTRYFCCCFASCPKMGVKQQTDFSKQISGVCGFMLSGVLSSFFLHVASLYVYWNCAVKKLWVDTCVMNLRHDMWYCTNVRNQGNLVLAPEILRGPQFVS